jgi:SAM-dependent methyltransferase
MGASEDGFRYKNQGNPSVLSRIPAAPCRILDVGCGAGDNARLLVAAGHEVWGITRSTEEAEVARPHLKKVWVGELESIEVPVPFGFFDVFLLSHILEHLAAPAAVLTRLAPLLRTSGIVVAAVPNMAQWRVRLRILRGDWSREDAGVFDRTHLQFWSVDTARDIFAGSPFELVEATGTDPAVPLRPLRRLAPQVAEMIDRRLGSVRPNLFASQVVLVAKKC